MILDRPAKFLLLLLLAGLLLSFTPPVAEAGGPWQSVFRLESKAENLRMHPFSLALDRQRRRYYVVDAAAGMIISFSAEGKEADRFDANGALQKPVAMARDEKGNLWVSDRQANQLLYISLKDKRVERFQVRHRDGHLVVPDKLVLDHKDHIYLLDLNGGRILKYDRQLNLLAEFKTAAGDYGFVDFRLKDGELWALDGVARKIIVFSTNGRKLREISLAAAGLSFPVALEIGSSGNIYILDRHAQQVVVCDRNGQLRYRFFTPGRNPGHLRYGSDLLFDWDGNLCIADEGNGRVEVLSR